MWLRFGLPPGLWSRGLTQDAAWPSTMVRAKCASGLPPAGSSLGDRRYQLGRAADRCGERHVCPRLWVLGPQHPDEPVPGLPVLGGTGFGPGSRLVGFPGQLGTDVGRHGQRSPREKSAISDGTAESNPDTSRLPGSSGGAIENAVGVSAATTSRVGIPAFRRYDSRA